MSWVINKFWQKRPRISFSISAFKVSSKIGRHRFTGPYSAHGALRSDIWRLNLRFTARIATSGVKIWHSSDQFLHKYVNLSYCSTFVWKLATALSNGDQKTLWIFFALIFQDNFLFNETFIVRMKIWWEFKPKVTNPNKLTTTTYSTYTCPLHSISFTNTIIFIHMHITQCILTTVNIN